LHYNLNIQADPEIQSPDNVRTFFIL